MNKKNILWIDDEAGKLKGLFYWNNKNDYNLVKCINKAEAEKEINENLNKYDLIILDLILPKGIDYDKSEITKVESDRNKYEGYEILKEITKKSNIPIMIMSIVSSGVVYNQILEDKKTNNNICDILTKGTLTPNNVKSAVKNLIG